jgi:hypothetical protein
MHIDLFKSVIDSIEGKVQFVTLASRGEPLLAKDFPAMMAHCAGKFLGLKVNTNASFLDEQKARMILDAEPNTVVFSADAADAKVYEKLRVNGNFERVLANIRRFKEIREAEYPNSKTLTRVSGVAYNLSNQNFDAMRRVWGEIVDQVAFVDYNPWENAYDAPTSGVIAPCSDLWRRLFVWWDGRINPCDVDYRSYLSPGSLAQGSTIAGVWRGKGYETLRERHLAKNRGMLVPCVNCVVT